MNNYQAIASNEERGTRNEKERHFPFGGSLFINVLASVDIYLSWAGLWAAPKKTHQNVESHPRGASGRAQTSLLGAYAPVGAYFFRITWPLSRGLKRFVTARRNCYLPLPGSITYHSQELIPLAGTVTTKDNLFIPVKIF